MKKRILLIRSGEFDVTPALPRFVSVLCNLESRPEIAALCWGGRDREMSFECSQQVRLLGYRGHFGRGSMRRLASLIGWNVRVSVEIIMGKYDVLQPSDVFCAIPCVVARMLLGRSLIVDVRDPIAASSGASFRRFLGILGVVEWLALIVADGVIIVDENRRAFLPGSKRYNQNTIVMRNLPMVDALPLVQGDHSESREILINYSGYLGASRGANLLLAVLSKCSGVRLDMIGDIKDESAAALSEKEAAQFHGRVGHRESINAMARASAVWIAYDPGILGNRVAAPNKFYESLMLGVPVIVSRGTPMDKVVEEGSLGWVIDYGDESSILGVVQEIQKNPSILKNRGRNARQYYERNLSWPVEKSKMTQFYERFVG